MKAFFKLAISIALIIAPVFLIMKQLFLPGPLAWGDAPFFYPEGLRELLVEPMAWSNRAASFGGVNNIIFLWPLMFLYGLIGTNDLAVRVIFYFPSLIFAGVGIYFLTRYLNFSKTTQFFAILTYLLNTYYILLVDGGQAGVHLAYGFFPLALYFLKKFFDNPSLNSFFLAAITSSVLTAFDPRVSAICLIALVFWQASEFKFKSLIYLLPLVGVLAALSSYWLLPLLKNSLSGVESFSGQGLVKWYYPLTLFSPNWPDNIFGMVSRPPWYFVGVTILILVGSLKQKRLLFLFLAFAFLTLGLIPFYKLPFGFAFRDSTKFFVPLVLFGGILIGSAADALQHWILRLGIYLFLLFLISPAILGNMNFVLSARQPSPDFQKIYENLKEDASYYRTAWFPEKYPIVYETADQPAVDAKDLANLRPFAAINAGEDVFNFLNNDDFTDWFRVLGIKYLIMSDNHREISKDERNQEDWNTITNLIDKNINLEKLDWGTKVPVYKLKENVYPRFYAVDKLVLVVGRDLSSSYPQIPSVYVEDGKWDPTLLQGKKKDSLKILFNGGDKMDLAMSFLQNYFIPVSKAKTNEWAYYSSKDYLKYKYELLIRGYTFRDFDYGAGIAFSTKVGEKIEFDTKKDSNDIYLVRKANKEKRFHWEEIGSNLTARNESDLEIVNVAAVVPKAEYDKALKLADVYIEHFGIITEDKLKIEQISAVEVEKFGVLKYKFRPPEKSYWLIFNESYHPLWQLTRGTGRFASFPVFSMVNGFYVDPEWGDLSIEFRGQESVRWGMYFTVISGLALAIFYIWKKSN